MLNRAVLVFLAWMLIVPSNAQAYECTRSSSFDFVSIHWSTTEPIPYAIQKNPDRRVALDALEAALETSFDSWSAPSCSSLAFDYKGEVDVGTELKEINQIVVVSADWPEMSLDAVGLTTMFYNPKNGVISHGKIEINEVEFEFVDVLESSCNFTTEYDLRAVLTHEIGHFIGLAHVSEEYRQERIDVGEDPPTMSPEVFECDEQFRTLEADDLEAVCYIYPAGRSSKSCATLPKQDSSFVKNDAFGCSSSNAYQSSLLSLILSLLVFYRLFRRRLLRP